MPVLKTVRISAKRLSRKICYGLQVRIACSCFLPTFQWHSLWPMANSLCTRNRRLIRMPARPWATVAASLFSEAKDKNWLREIHLATWLTLNQKQSFFMTPRPPKEGFTDFLLCTWAHPRSVRPANSKARSTINASINKQPSEIFFKGI